VSKNKSYPQFFVSFHGFCSIIKLGLSGNKKIFCRSSLINKKFKEEPIMAKKRKAVKKHKKAKKTKKAKKHGKKRR